MKKIIMSLVLFVAFALGAQSPVTTVEDSEVLRRTKQEINAAET